MIYVNAFVEEVAQDFMLLKETHSTLDKAQYVSPKQSWISPSIQSLADHTQQANATQVADKAEMVVMEEVVHRHQARLLRVAVVVEVAEVVEEVLVLVRPYTLAL